MRKPVVLQKYRKINQFQKLTTISFFFSFFIFESSARKNDIIDVGEQITLSITDATKKRRPWISRILPSATRSLEESLLTNLSHLYPPQMLPQNTQKRPLKKSSKNHTVQSWCGNDLPPEQWVQKMSNRKCLLVQMTKPPSPLEPVKVIRCDLKIECTARCTSIICGLKCISFCTGFREVLRQNCVLSYLHAQL